MIEYALRNLDFYLEVDEQFTFDGHETYKFADADQINVQYRMILIRMGGWDKGYGHIYVKKDIQK